MLPILNITSTQFMLSNILLAQINMAYLSTPSHLQHFKHSIIYHIITIRRPTQKRRRLYRHNSTKSHPSTTPYGVVNLVVHHKKALHLNCSNFYLSLIFSSAALVDHLHGKQYVKIIHSSVTLKTKYVHQQMHHITTIPETSCQQLRNSRSIC